MGSLLEFPMRLLEVAPSLNAGRRLFSIVETIPQDLASLVEARGSRMGLVKNGETAFVTVTRGGR
ncbi:hypothetical protein GCM10007881_43250 [Mesorhizobium huakuii]|nr:hypothetical protein GCM10007881_43250 [Mesorhizobium huakuii]